MSKKVTFQLEKNEVYEIERSNIVEIVGKPGVDNWEFFAIFRENYGYEFETYIKMKVFKKNMKRKFKNIIKYLGWRY